LVLPSIFAVLGVREEQSRRDLLKIEIDGGDEPVVVAADVEHPHHDAALVDSIGRPTERRGHVRR